jgi:hypothetical protein
MKVYLPVLMMSCTLLLSACGGDSSSSEPDQALVGGADSSEPDQALPVGQFSLAVSDSPMTDVSHVGMVMGELVITDADGVEHRRDLQGQGTPFNLLDYQGMDKHLVVDNIDLPAGLYHDAHITVEQGDGNQGSFIDNGQGRHGLQVTDGQLPVADFEIVADQSLDMTLEIDLYRGLSQTDGQFMLNHEAMWSIDNSQMGHLLGEVDPQWIADCETTYAGLAPDGSQFSHLAYLYPESVTDITQMADMGSTPADGLIAPMAVGHMMQDADGNWYFSMGYLPEGNYRVGYTCLSHLDDPVNDDISNGSFEMFKNAGAITIESGTEGGQQTIHQCGNGNGGHHGMNGGMDGGMNGGMNGG